LGEPFLDQPGSKPATKNDAFLWIVFAFVGFLAAQVAGLIFTVVAADLAGKGSQLTAISKLAAPPEWYVGASLVGVWVGFFGGPWFATLVAGSRRLFADLGIRFHTVDLVGIPIGIAAQYLIALLYSPFIKNLHNFNGPTTKITGGAHGGGFAVIAVLTIAGAPFFEELFFRGLLFKGLARLFTPRTPGPGARRALGVAAAILVDGLLFGLAHFELDQFAGLALFGAILAAMSYRTGRLGMNILSHASFNAVAVVAVLNSRGVIH